MKAGNLKREIWEQEANKWEAFKREAFKREAYRMLECASKQQWIFYCFPSLHFAYNQAVLSTKGNPPKQAIQYQAGSPTAKQAILPQASIRAAKRDSTAAKQESTAAKRDSTAAKRESTAAKRDSPAAKRDSPAAKRDSPAAMGDKWAVLLQSGPIMLSCCK